MDPFLVFVLWGPMAILRNRNPRGFRIPGVVILVLFGIGMWFALYPSGELVGGKELILLAMAIAAYIVVGFFYIWNGSE